MNNETVIIGGGPAGSAAAILLARHGMPVRLLERQTGAHHKVCGEFISYEAAHYLQQLGLDLPALGAEPIHQVRLYNGEQTLAFRLPFTAWSLSRRVLDSALLELAERAGANVERGTVVRQLSHTGSEWELLTGSRVNSGQASATIFAKTVFLATGKHELRDWPRIAKGNVNNERTNTLCNDLQNGAESSLENDSQKKAQPKMKKNVRGVGNNFIGLKMHFSPTELSQSPWQGCVEIHLFNGGYAGLEPIEQGGVNLCFLIQQDIYKACGSNWPEVLAWLGHSSSHLKHRLAHLTPCWPEPLAVAGIPYGYIGSPDAAVPGLFRLGDQLAVIPSFAGDGIAIALHTASLAAQVHCVGGDSGSYQRQACKQLTPPVRNARLLATLLSSSAGRNTVFTLAHLSPIRVREKLLRELVRRTRAFVPVSLDLA